MSYPAMGKSLIAMSGEPAILQDALELAASWEQYVGDAHDAVVNKAQEAAQKAASTHASWAAVSPHIKAWVTTHDELVVGLPAGHEMSDEANELEYGSETSAPHSVLRAAALHDHDGLARAGSKALQWP